MTGARQPLRRRMTVLIVALCVLVFAMTGSVTFVALIDSLRQRIDAQLLTTAAGLRALSDIDSGVSEQLVPAGTGASTYGNLYIAIIRPGRTAQGPGPLLPRTLPPPGEPVTVPGTGAGAARSYRLLAVRLTGGRTGVVALSRDETEGAIQVVIGVVIAVELLGVTVLGLLSAWAIRRELRPLERAARTADLIASGDLTQRLREPALGARTEVGRLSLALDRMLDQIQAAFEARDTSEGRLRQFVADASHELRTPLQSIRAYAELYLRGALPDAAAEGEAVRRIRAEVRRMSALVESLLQLARFDEGHEAGFQTVDLSEIVLDCCRDAAAVQPGRPFSWDVAERLTVAGDAEQLSRLAGNLLGNVRMHTGPDVPCRLTLETGEEGVLLRVMDQGPGIPEEALPHVFDRFYRADRSRSRAKGGSGLGLSIVAAIVDAHGGRVRIDAHPREGTSVEVWLPPGPQPPLSGGPR